MRSWQRIIRQRTFSAWRDKNQGAMRGEDDSVGSGKFVAMLEYRIDGKHYLLSYQNLREEHYRFCQMPDDEFLGQLPAAAHLACVICFLKEIPTDAVLCDTGIIHELIHLIHIPEGNTTSLRDIRSLFEKILRLD